MSGREQIFRGDAGAGGRLRNSGGGGGSGDTTDGLIPRSMRYLFQRIAALPLGVTMRVRASFYEIYNEFVYDLLAQGDRRPLQVRCHSYGIVLLYVVIKIWTVVFLWGIECATVLGVIFFL